MQAYREFIHSSQLDNVVNLPPGLKNREVELIVLPTDGFEEKTSLGRKLKLTQYKCFGKKTDFSKEDAYDERF